MNLSKIKYLIFIVFCGFQLMVLGQKKPTKIELKQANSLEGKKINGVATRILKGNVIFEQDGTLMYCDSAYQYTQSNSIEAFGNVRMIQGDSTTLSGNKLIYNGNTKKAKVIGNVVLVDKKMTLKTDILNYDTEKGIGYYTTGAYIVDGENKLKSKKGTYNTNTSFFMFKDSVNLVNPQYTIDCDTLNYSSNSKIAYFLGPTTIQSDSGSLFAYDGEYNTQTGESTFSKDASIDNKDYTLKGDYLHFNQKDSVGTAKGNVIMTLKMQNIIIYADDGFYNQKTGISKSYGNVLMKYLMGNDTLYIKSDTLISLVLNDELQEIFAFYNVRFFKQDMKGLCDSLHYSVIDSSIFFFGAPVLWSSASQLTGENIKITLDSNEIDKMYINKDAFMVSEDSLKNYNQIKGKDMIAHFIKGNLEVLDVIGNGQSLYYALEGDSILVGLNKTICSNMIIRLDSSELQNITFLTDPNANFIPPHKINLPDRKLPGFIWRKREEPIFEEFLLKKKDE